MKPTIGRIVLYVLSSQDVAKITSRRAANVQISDRVTDGWRIDAKPEHSTPVELGQIFPAMVVRVDDEAVNLKVMLDGADDLWVTSRVESDTQFPGTWHWMEYQKLQAAKSAGLPPMADPIPGDVDPIDSSGTALGLKALYDADKRPLTSDECQKIANELGIPVTGNGETHTPELATEKEVSPAGSDESPAGIPGDPEPPAGTPVDTSILLHENGAPKFRTDESGIHHLDDQGNKFEPGDVPAPATTDPDGNPVTEQTPEELEKLKEEVGF